MKFKDVNWDWGDKNSKRLTINYPFPDKVSKPIVHAYIKTFPVIRSEKFEVTIKFHKCESNSAHHCVGLIDARRKGNNGYNYIYFGSAGAHGWGIFTSGYCHYSEAKNEKPVGTSKRLDGCICPYRKGDTLTFYVDKRKGKISLQKNQGKIVDEFTGIKYFPKELVVATDCYVGDNNFSFDFEIVRYFEEDNREDADLGERIEFLMEKENWSDFKVSIGSMKGFRFYKLLL